ncbi:MAG TPA: hypothetical protein VK815_00435 [Candidatus Acidoferrales bacterium]|jgi:hypothetical protein|nr:hypothetical protein [Candidatus Acidoferrales bacterium]
MKKKILMLIAFSIVATALVGCQPKTDSNPPAATNGAVDQAAPGTMAPEVAGTNNSPMPTNPASTNSP